MNGIQMAISNINPRFYEILTKFRVSVKYCFVVFFCKGGEGTLLNYAQKKSTIIRYFSSKHYLEPFLVHFRLLIKMDKHHF